MSSNGGISFTCLIWQLIESSSEDRSVQLKDIHSELFTDGHFKQPSSETSGF